VLAVVRARWQTALQGLWFLPSLVTVAFAALALVLIQIDRIVGPDGVPFVFGGTASAARTVLSTVAGSVITVAGLAFSITIITLQLVSQQFSPRATRTFLGNKPTQIAAGVFVGVFVYCLLVLRTVREEDVGDFVPGVAVAGAIALGVLGIGVLLFFINHTAQSIKVTSIASRVARETLSAIDDLYPERYGEPGDEDDAEEIVAGWWEGGEPHRVRPVRPGFVQRIDLDELVERMPDGVSRLHVGVVPGEFVTEEQSLVAVWPEEAAARDEGLDDGVRRVVVVHSEREVRDDAAYGIQQLADIALRAISPSVNDPTTAVTCAGYLAACLERLAGRAFPHAHRHFRGGTLEAVVRRPNFRLFVALGIDDVGRWAASYPRVVQALLSAVARAAAAAAERGAGERVDVLLASAERVAAPALEEARSEADRADLEHALDAARRAARGQETERRLAVGAHRPS
jgi:uncharacterized membrane protein